MPDHIIEIGYAFWKAKALLTAVELGLFTVLADGPLKCEELIFRLSLQKRGALDFLDALVALKLLDRNSDGRYANSPDTNLYLDRGKPTYIGGMFELLNARLYQNWSSLTQVLRTGLPLGSLRSGGYPALFGDKLELELFLKAMTGGTLIAARMLSVKFPWHVYSTFIDIGSAEGCLPVEIARSHAHLTGGGFDLPVVEPSFTSYVRACGLSERLQFYPGDFMSAPLPKADVLVMGRILHNWDLSTKKFLVKKAYDALQPGGALIVYDGLIDDNRSFHAHNLLASLNMLIETSGGSEYTGGDCIRWMQETGFHQARLESLGSVNSAIIGFK